MSPTDGELGAEDRVGKVMVVKNLLPISSLYHTANESNKTKAPGFLLGLAYVLCIIQL
jgi:hypothetical protein